MKRKNTNITEIRVEEVHNHEEKKHFFRIYFYHESGKIEIIFVTEKIYLKIRL